MIYLRKINVFKKAKINLTKLTETYNKNKKTNAAQFNEYFEVYNEKCQKKRGGGMLIIFLCLNMLQRVLIFIFFYREISFLLKLFHCLMSY